MEKNEILKIENLRIAFDSDGQKNEVISGIDLSLKKGECLGIVGESGSGKTLSCMSIINLIPSDSHITDGRVTYSTSDHKVSLHDLEKDEIRAYRGKEIAVIFQEPLSSFNPSSKCGIQVEEMLIEHSDLNKKKRYSKVLELFEKVELPDPERIYKSYPHELSGGQLQRIMIAMAISCQPKILIADEPTTALDVSVQKGVLSLLKKLQIESGMSILFISHDLGVISSISDRVAVMYDGKIIEKGRTQELLQDPQKSYTKGLIQCRPSFNSDVKLLSVYHPHIDTISNPQFWTKGERESRTKRIQNAPNILETRNLNVSYSLRKNFFGKVTKSFEAVKNVSLHIKKGETLGLVGESGSGKSSIGKAIMRIISSRSEGIYLEGRDISTLSMKSLKTFRKDIQYVFQDPYSSLNPRMTVGKAIMEPMTIHLKHLSKREAHQKTLRLLEKVGLQKDHFNRYPHEFSGGQRQRICIARAIACKPKVLICDECVSALDVSVQAQVLNLLVNLREEMNISYLFISHDLSVVHFISDRICVLKDGTVEETGSRDDIFKHPRQEYTKMLIKSISTL